MPKKDKVTGPDWKADKSTGPEWKPDKDATQSNYGQAVSEAANTKPKPSAKPRPHADGQAHQGPK